MLRAAWRTACGRQARANLAERREPGFAVVVFDGWSGDPVAQLASGGARASSSDTSASALLPTSTRARSPTRSSAGPSCSACELVLVLDQVEEYFLYHGDEEAGVRATSCRSSSRAAAPRRRVDRDARGRAGEARPLQGRGSRTCSGTTCGSSSSTARAARAAIVGPIERYNELAQPTSQVELEPALVDAVLDQAVAGKVDLGDGRRGSTPARPASRRVEAPYLQLVMQRVWDEERGEGSNGSGLTTLERLGGAEAIVRAHLDRALERALGRRTRTSRQTSSTIW